MASAPRHLIPGLCWVIVLTAIWAMAQNLGPDGGRQRLATGAGRGG